MHVALILMTGEGGIPHYTAELANALSTIEGAEVTVVKPEMTTADDLFDSKTNTRNWFRNPGISISNIATRDVSVWNIISSCLSIRNLSDISTLEPDVIHFTHKPHSYFRPFIPELGLEEIGRASCRERVLRLV